MPGRPLTVLFMPESAYGPTNNCIGIGDVLRRRGHRVVFAAEASWKGRLEPLGFEEDLVDLSPPAERAPQDAGAFWKEFIASTAPEFRKPTIEQLDTWIKPVWAKLISGARYCQEQLAEIVARTRPDVIVEDNVISFPALLTAGVPFVRIVSCNPLEVADPALPPAFSGYPAGDQAQQDQAQQDQAQWREFRAEYDRVHRAMWAEFSDWVTARAPRPCRTWNSSTPARPTCTSTRRSPITGGPGRSGRAGTGWIPRSGRPTSRSPCPGRWPAAAGRSSTSRLARWGRPTWP